MEKRKQQEKQCIKGRKKMYNSVQMLAFHPSTERPKTTVTHLLIQYFLLFLLSSIILTFFFKSPFIVVLNPFFQLYHQQSCLSTRGNSKRNLRYFYIKLFFFVSQFKNILSQFFSKLTKWNFSRKSPKFEIDKYSMFF